MSSKVRRTKKQLAKGEKEMKKSLEEKLSQYIGKYIAIWCVRYTYRGKIVEVGESHFVLHDAHAVEVTGAARNLTPQKEDCIPSELVIHMDAIEMVIQSTWANAPCKLGSKCPSFKGNG